MATGIGRIDPPSIKLTPEQGVDRELLRQVLVILTVCYEQLKEAGIVFDTDPLVALRGQDFRATS